VQISPDEIVFSAPIEDRVDIERTLDRWRRLVIAGRPKVSVVGAGMKSHPGIARRFRKLREGGPAAVVTTSRSRSRARTDRRRGEDRSRAPQHRPASVVSRATGAVGGVLRDLLRGGTTCTSSPPPALGHDIDGRTVEEATPEALESGGLDLCLGDRRDGFG
jgi:hypothetical protein